MPIAVFSYDTIHEEPNSFRLAFPFLDVLQFHFYKLELKQRNWREYIQNDNPVAAALLSKMGYAQEEKVRVKVEFIRMLTRMQLDPARMKLLIGFFETYLKLNETEENKFEAELNMLEPREASKVIELTTSWHERGRAEGQIELMLRQARKRFGQVPMELEKEIRALPKEKIEALGEALLDIGSLEELRALIY